MHHLGWNSEDARETFELSLAREDLLETWERYAGEAARSIFQVGMPFIGLNPGARISSKGRDKAAGAL